MKNTTNKNQLKDIVQLYWNWLKESELTCSPHTIRSYEVSVREYFSYLQDAGVSPKNFSIEKALGKEMILSWRRHLLEVKKCSPETSNVRLANLRSFLGYLAETDLKYAHFFMEARNIKATRTVKKRKHAIPQETFNAIMAIPDSESKSGCFDIMVMSFLFGTAVRVGEMRMVQIKT